MEAGIFSFFDVLFELLLLFWRWFQYYGIAGAKNPNKQEDEESSARKWKLFSNGYFFLVSYFFSLSITCISLARTRQQATIHVIRYERKWWCVDCLFVLSCWLLRWSARSAPSKKPNHIAHIHVASLWIMYADVILLLLALLLIIK